MKKPTIYGVITLFIILTIACSNVKKNREELFTEEFFQMLSTKVSGLQMVTIENLHLTTKHNEEIRNHFLDNAYSEFKRELQSKNEILEKYANASKDIYLPQPKFDQNKIVPVIKDLRYLNELQKLANSDTIEAIYERYNEDLLVFYAQDLENSISYLMQKDLKENNIKQEELREISINNLMRIIDKINKKGDNRYSMIQAGGIYEASLILNDSIWTKENFPVLGEIVIGIPSRELLFVTGSEDYESLKSLKIVVKEINYEGDHLISKNLYIYKNNKFETYDPIDH